MIVPRKNYDVTVKFSPQRNRWMARFESIRPPGISMEFPLPDGTPYEVRTDSRISRESGVGLGQEEETLLALVFSQMVENALESMRAQSPALSAPVSQSEVALVE